MSLRPCYVEIRRSRWRRLRWTVVALDCGSTMDSPAVICLLARCRFRSDAERVRDYWLTRSIGGGA